VSKSGLNDNARSGWTSAHLKSALVPDTISYAGGTDATEQHYTGKERDTESGNDYFGARYYASTMGRFLSPDWSAKIAPVPYAKLNNPQSLNLYSYVLNNPLTLTDADGHACADPKKGCPITIQFRAFIPQKSMDGFKGDNRSFSNDPNASSRVSTTATINTDSSANGGNPLVSSSSKVQPTTLLPGVDGGVTKTASGPQMPQVTASQDKDGNVTLHLTENVRNPFQPGGNGITASVNIMIPQSGASASVSGSLSGSPSFELNVSSQTGPTANIPVAGSSSSPIMFPINLETQRQVNVTGQVP
jgi:RHS repeat-associated protein